MKSISKYNNEGSQNVKQIKNIIKILNYYFTYLVLARPSAKLII